MSKKKELTLAVILIIFIVAVIALVVANSPAKNNNVTQEKTTVKFELIDTHYIGDDINFLHQYIFYDPETRVMYTCIGDGGPLTVMVDKDGMPRLYVPKNMK